MSTATPQIPPITEDERQAQKDAHRDPLSGRAGAHPVGTGLGATVGGAAVGVTTGAMLGTIAGPVGTAVGAAIGVAAGAIAGGLAGKAVAEEIDPTLEHGFWRENFASRPYLILGTTYDDYGPAYQFGWESVRTHPDQTFEQAEPALHKEWNKVKGASKLGWADAKLAVHDAWERIFARHNKHSN